MNAKKELLDHIESREVKYVRVIRKISYSSEETVEGPTATDNSFESVLWRRLACDFRIHAGWKLEDAERNFRENFRRTLAECPREET